MSTTAPPSPQNPFNTTPLIMLVVIFGLLPILILIGLYATDLGFILGQALGVNLPANDNLVVYSTTCKEGKDPNINIVYWARSSAPLTVTAENYVSPDITSQAGINVIDVTVRALSACPDSIILTDKSRGWRAGSPVEIIQ